MKTLYSVLAVVVFLLGSLAVFAPQTAFAATCTASESGEVCDNGSGISQFSFNLDSTDYIGVISGSNISVTVPVGTDVTALTPNIVPLAGSVSPESGISNNFTQPVLYTFTTGDKSASVQYTVTVLPTLIVPPAAKLALTIPTTATITQSTLVPETNGVPTGGNDVVTAAVSGLTPIAITLQNTGDVASANVRISPIGTSPHIQLWAKDSANNWYDINVTGWIDTAGIAVPASYSATTNVYVISDIVDSYPVGINLVNVADGSLVTSAAGSITVNAPTNGGGNSGNGGTTTTNWGATVALSNNIQATGSGSALTATLSVPTGGTSIQFNNTTANPFNEALTPPSKIAFTLTSTGGVDLNAYYRATKQGTDWTSGWGQYLIKTLPGATGQTGMFYITYDGANYKIQDGTQDFVGHVSDMLIPSDFPAGTYALTGTVNGTPVTITLTITNPNAWVAPSTPTSTTFNVSDLQPNWNTGVFSAYIGPSDYSYVTPGVTSVYDGREAGIIKAGLNIDANGHYWDEGLLAFKVNSVDIASFASQTLSYDVENQTGTNPVWVRIRMVGGAQYQFIPSQYSTGWHTINAGAGQWQLMDNNGNGIGSMMTLTEVAAANPGLAVDRVYLTLGMGDSYNVSPGVGTVAWVDKATIGSVTYDFVVTPAPVVDKTAPTLTIAGFTASGTPMTLTGSAYTMHTDGNANTHYALQFASGSLASESLKDETVGLTLAPTDASQTAALVSYYSTKPAEWQTYLDAAAAGSQPFAYIKTGGTTIQILDGAMHKLASQDVNMIVPGDYPAGTYTVSGTIHDLAGNSTTVTFVLTVVAPSNMTAYNDALAAVHQADYTTASWATYQGVVNAHNVTDQNTQAEVDAATTAITEAQGDLVLFLTHGTTLPSFTTTPSGDGQTQSGTITTAAEATANSNGFATTLDIPAGTVVTGPSAWNGVVSMPIATVATVTLRGYNTQVTSAIAIGSSDVSLTLSHAARLVFALQGGKEVGWIDHSGHFTRITEVCSADNQADVDTQLGLNGDCVVTSTPGSDLVVWTKHFTTFVTLGITPQLSTVLIASSNTNPQYAKVGDAVTVTFSSAADLVSPTVDIAGHTGITAIASTTPSVWTASYTLQTGDTEGVIAFNVHFEDADHSGGEVTATTDGSSVTYDKTAPTATVTYSTTASTNTNVTATITPSESVTVTNNSGSQAHTFSANGTFTFNLVDAAGNTGTVDATINNIDKVPPVITLSGNATAQVVYGNTYSDAGATASDNVDGVITSHIVTSNPVNTSVPGIYTVTYNVTDAAGNPAVEVTRTVTVVKADQTITWVDPADITYGTTLSSTQLNAVSTGDGTATYTPALGTLLNAGNGQTLSVTYSATANYNSATQTVQINVNKATPTVNTTPYAATYDGATHTASGVVTGALGESLTGLVLTDTTHTNAGDYPADSWVFTDTTGNYNNASGTVHDGITKADAHISVSGYTGTYDGAAHGATGTATGVESTPANLNTLLHLGSTFVNVPGGTVHWTFDGNSNYNSNTGADVSISFAKANQSITFAPLADKNYGDADFAVGATAVSGFAVTFAASGSCTISGTIVHLTTKGDCTITARQNGDSNWNAATDVANTFAIHDVVAPIITRTGDATVEAIFGHTYTDAGATATDDVDSSVTVTTSGAVDTSVLGTYTLTYNASDTAHNAATAITRTVRVVPQNSNSGSTGSGGGSSHASAPTAPASTGSVGGGEVLGAATFNFSSDLTLGATGEAVNALQQILIDAGYLKIASPMGTFGPQTAAAVKLYQKAHGITASGYVGPLTRTQLNTGSITTADQEAHTMLIIKIKAALADALAKLMELQKQLQAQS